jgi:shikimate kinase
MNLYLVGFMASGKSTLGRFLSEYSGRSFRDLDRIIEAEAGMPIREIFAKEGESTFRAREIVALEQIAKLDGFIVATGGGVIESDPNHELLKGGFTVFLDWSWEALEPWLKKVSRRSRPLLEQGDNEVHALFERRLPLYRKVADQVESITDVKPEKLGEMLGSLCEGIHDGLLKAEQDALE